MSLFDLTADTNVRKLMKLNPEFPKDVETTVIKGSTTSATFSVEIAEHGKPAEYTYQWYVNDTPVEGATKATYERTDLSETETLSIYCEVTNKKGTIRSRTATLKVTQYFLPVLNGSYPQDITTERGTSVTCKAEIATAGNPNSYTYQWYKNGSAVSGATNASYTYIPSAVGKTTLYCKVTNAAGTVTSRTATITTIYTLIPGSNVFANKVTTGGFKEVYQSGTAYHIYIEGTGGVAVPIDVTGFNTMQIYGEYGYAKVDTYTGLFSESPTYKNCIVGFHNTTRNGEYFEKTYDISSVTGVRYFGMACKLKDAEKPSLHANLFSVVFR